MAASEIRHFEQLLEPFEEGIKHNGTQLLGTESEKFGIFAAEGTPLSYDGRKCGVVGYFEHLASSSDWTPVRERADGPTIALERGYNGSKQQISLEPGAQLELSGSPVETVHEVAEELRNHMEIITPISTVCGVRWLAAGFHPFATQEQLPWVPKDRYRVMRDYFPKVGARGLDMMRRTATVQVNMDFADERDAITKLRVALKLSPVATAIFANSPLSEGEPNGLKSERAWVWLDTDADRTGLLPAMLEDDASFATYANWALDVPMYLIKRRGEIVANTGQTFRSFWQDGFDGHRARQQDWIYHLNTLFPEVRLQRTIEVRGADSLPRSLLPAVPALWAGLLYDTQALEAADRLTRSWNFEALQAARPDIARRGLGAELDGKPVRAVAETIIALAMEGLSRRAQHDAEGRDERVHLEPIARLVAEGLSPADSVLKALNGNTDRAAIIAATEM